MAPPKADDPLVLLMAKIEEGNRETHRMMGEMQSTMKTLEDSVVKLSAEHDRVESWKPEVESKLSRLGDSVQDLKIRVESFIYELPSKSTPD